MNSQIYIKQAVSAYLNDIASRLSNQPDDQRAKLLKQLESHIYEALDARCAGKEPTLADLEFVFQEMDPPESYGEVVIPYATPSPANPSVKSARDVLFGRIALALCVLGWIIIIARASNRRMDPDLQYLGLAFEIIAIMLGVASWSTRMGKMATIGGSAIFLVMV